MRHMDRRTDRRTDDVGNGNGNGNGSPTYLLPLTSYPRKRRKVRGQYSGRSCGGQRIQSTELAAWLHGSMLRKGRAGQDRAGQNMADDADDECEYLDR